MAGHWLDGMTAPFNVGLMMLLTDGSVLAQNTGTSLWWRLRPDRAGRYNVGEWKPTGSSASAPLYFASAVLKDGDVFIAGGEYSNNASTPADLCTAEVYDPTAETWASLPTPPGWTAIGDAPCCVLNDGRLLLGGINSAACALWDPVTRAWSAGGAKANGTSNEETWTLLPDGSVLTLDCFGQPQSERFLNSTWLANGATPNTLVEVSSSEIGPAVLLPDGTVLAIGATGSAGRYRPDPDPAKAGIWSAAPDIPRTAAGPVLGAKDAPACLLPNGHVLAAVGPVDGVKENYLGPVSYCEFDPVANAWSPIDPPPNQGDLAPYNFIFLLLPNGQVLVSNGTPALQIYQPDGAPDPSWAPTIDTCPTTIQPGESFQLQGTQLNGLSQACAYGDDAAMATNYPIVRLRATAPSDTVVYCRTFHHSTMGVATGPSLQETTVAVPTCLAPGIYQLSVVANGIASLERAVTVAAAAKPSGRWWLSSQSSAGGERRVFGEEDLFIRDLSEVHLLIDFISGRSDKSLSGLKDVTNIDSSGSTVDSMSSQRAVEEICKITYPPGGSIESAAQQAAFMLIVKDKLNQLAWPARGLTVAFTSMVAGVALGYDNGIANLLDRAKRSARKQNTPVQTKPAKAVDDRRHSATMAYPNLEKQARSFREFYRRLAVWATLLVILVIWVNWDVSVTGATLKRLADAESSYTTAYRSNPKAELGSLASAIVTGRSNLRGIVQNGWWWRPVGLSVWMFGLDNNGVGSPHPPNRATTSTESYDRPSAIETFTSDVLSGINFIVIPSAFGLLGTLVGLMRSITAKVRQSTLAPRDHLVARISLCLGVSAGLAVGLFLSANDGTSNATATAAASQTLTKTIISAAGLSFLAGFGAETFFAFLDTLLTRLMPTNSTGTGNGVA